MVSEVDRYVEKQGHPQREIVMRLREIVMKTLPKAREDLWMGVPWYDRKFYIVALRDHVNLGFSVKGLSDREKAFFEGRGDMMRHLKFRSLEDVDEERVSELLKMVALKDTTC